MSTDPRTILINYGIISTVDYEGNDFLLIFLIMKTLTILHHRLSQPSWSVDQNQW
jgi:hypothetical protein